MMVKGALSLDGFPAQKVRTAKSVLSHDLSIHQATGLDAWASMVKCPARIVSHLHEICIYI